MADRKAPGASPRLRLTAAAALVIAAALVTSSFGTVAALRHDLLTSIDAAARDDAHDIAAQAARRPPGGSIEPPTPDAAVQVLDARRRVVAASANAPPDPLLGTGGTRPASITATGPLPLPNPADSYHVAALRTPDGAFTVFVALPSDDVADAVGRLTRVLAIGAPLLFLVLVALAWAVIGRALAPMTALHRRQQEFVSDAAHELRTPLAGLLARLELVGEDDTLDARAELPRLRSEVARMGSLVEGLLALVRAGDNRPPSTDVDLDDVVRESVERLRDRTTLTVDATAVQPLQTSGDRAALSRLVDNLLDNAERHAASRISVTLARERQTGVLTVADDGPGIAPTDRERVFGRFTRLDTSRARTDGGAGLGLAIVRAVADAHGGDVAVHDNAPGAALVVRIPVHPAGPSERSA